MFRQPTDQKWQNDVKRSFFGHAVRGTYMLRPAGSQPTYHPEISLDPLEFTHVPGRTLPRVDGCLLSLRWMGDGDLTLQPRDMSYGLSWWFRLGIRFVKQR